MFALVQQLAFSPLGTRTCPTDCAAASRHDVHLSNETNSPNPLCDLFHESAIADITAQHPDLIIVTSGAGNRLVDGNFPSPSQ